MGRGITAKVGLIATSVAVVGASIAVPVATSGTAGAATGGTWTIDPQPAPVRAIHVALMHTGKVLLAAGSGNDKAAFAAKSFATSVWDPVTNTYHAVSTPWDAFCAGHAFLPDGRILVTGGTQGYPRPVTDDQFAGSKKAYVFDPKTETYVAQENMNTARWYPSVTELGDGRLFTVGGLNSSGVRSNKNQIFDGFKWSQNADPPPQLSFMPMYPSMHLLRDGRLFYSGVNVFGAGTSQPGIWNIQTNAFQPVPGLTDPDRRDQGAERAPAARAGPEGARDRRRLAEQPRVRDLHDRDRRSLEAEPHLHAGAGPGHHQDVRERGDPAGLDRDGDGRCAGEREARQHAGGEHADLRSEDVHLERGERPLRPADLPLVRAPAPRRAGRDLRRQPDRRVRAARRDVHAAVPRDRHSPARSWARVPRRSATARRSRSAPRSRSRSSRPCSSRRAR